MNWTMNLPVVPVMIRKRDIAGRRNWCGRLWRACRRPTARRCCSTSTKATVCRRSPWPWGLLKAASRCFSHGRGAISDGITASWSRRRRMTNLPTFAALSTQPLYPIAGAPVALSVSGGKDSGAMALATSAYLDELGHQGPRLLIHADLGRVEWRESLPMCQRLADRLDLPLVVVRRQAGDLLDRWRVRWQNNCERYANLETVRLILPWSTASMLFCRSELKAAIICRELVQRFPQQMILSATGIRWQESSTRAKAPIWAPQYRLENATHKTKGVD